MLEQLSPLEICVSSQVLTDQWNKPVHKSSKVYVFHRRIINSSNFIHILGFIVFTGAAWILFNEFPSLWGTAATLLLLGLAAVNIVFLMQQPIRLVLDDRSLRVDTPFAGKTIPYERIERLHRVRAPFSWRRLRPGEILKIELKNGEWITVDRMRGKLKTIRAILETRVYGRSL